LEGFHPIFSGDFADNRDFNEWLSLSAILLAPADGQRHRLDNIVQFRALHYPELATDLPFPNPMDLLGIGYRILGEAVARRPGRFE
jgi:hypothetical protein